MEDAKYAILPQTGRGQVNESNVTTTTDEHFLENDFSLPDELDYKQLESSMHEHMPAQQTKR